MVVASEMCAYFDYIIYYFYFMNIHFLSYLRISCSIHFCPTFPLEVHLHGSYSQYASLADLPQFPPISLYASRYDIVNSNNVVIYILILQYAI